MTAGLEHKAVEAQTQVANELGEFSALAATYDVDRVKDRIRFGAFAKTITRWQASGRRVPLHWDHRGEARNVIGSIEPAAMREIAGVGLYVKGKLDLDHSEVARQAWRSIKDNRVGLSFGYMTVKSQRPRNGSFAAAATRSRSRQRWAGSPSRYQQPSRSRPTPSRANVPPGSGSSFPRPT
jgi:HK97 family phage prohead protease